MPAAATSVVQQWIARQDSRVMANHQWLVWIATNSNGLLQWTLHHLGGTRMNDFKRKLLAAILATMHQLCMAADPAKFGPFGVKIQPLPAGCGSKL